MNIYDLPIEVDKTITVKDRAFIHENKIVCHPDLVDKVKEGMSLLRASATGFDRDMVKITLPKEVEKGLKNRSKNEQKKDITTDPPTNAGGH